jgi:arginase
MAQGMNETKSIRLIEVPYHIGFQDEGMARGPEEILAAGLLDNLQEAGFDVSHGQALREEVQIDEFSAILGVNQAVKEQVTIALEAGAFPLVLSGGCSASLGALAATDTSTTGILWFDAHGDYNTPETTPSGYFGGMPLAVANGLGHSKHWQGLTSQPTIVAANTILIGIRDLDPGEKENLLRSVAQLVPGEMFVSGTAGHFLRNALVKLGASVRQVYLHLDIDVLDPEIAPGISYPSPEGLTLNQLNNVLTFIGNLVPVRVASLAAFNPAKDVAGKTLSCAKNLAQTLATRLNP